jgi:hypothetical protein
MRLRAIRRLQYQKAQDIAEVAAAAKKAPKKRAPRATTAKKK